MIARRDGGKGRGGSTRKITALVLAVASMLALGCGGAESDGDDSLDGVPELAAIEMRLTGDEAAEALGTEEDAIEPEAWVAEELDAASGEVEEESAAADLRSARSAVRRLNQALRDFLLPVAALVRHREPDRQLGKLKVWGPVVRGTTEYRFLLYRSAAGRFAWRLDARVAESSAAFGRVAAGRLLVGAEVRRGMGQVGFDLDALGSVDPTVMARGKVFAGFAHGERGTTVRYALRDFRPSAEEVGVDALLGQVRLASGIYRVRLAYRGDVEGTPSSAEELVLARVRHVRGSGGRSDVIVAGGDLPGTELRVISQCWDETLSSVYRIVRSCPGDGPGGEQCTVVSVEGELEDCLASLAEPELPPVEPSEPMADAEDPNGDVEAPEAMPSVDEIREP